VVKMPAEPVVPAPKEVKAVKKKAKKKAMKNEAPPVSTLAFRPVSAATKH
jgi:hypothetical protein